MFRWFELYTCAKTAGEDGQEVVAVSPYMITTQPNMSSTEVRLTICPSSLRNNTVYVRYYILLANLIVMALGPLLIMSVLNTLLYKAIKRTGSRHERRDNRKRRDHRDKTIALILVGIVIVFAFCNVFRIIINLYEVSQRPSIIRVALWLFRCVTWSCLEISISTGHFGMALSATQVLNNSLIFLMSFSRCSIMSDFSHLFLVLNSSVNIIIYSWKDKKFRELLLKLFYLECLVNSEGPSVMSARDKEASQTQLTISYSNVNAIATICESQC